MTGEGRASRPGRSAYDPLFGRSAAQDDDLDSVRDLFESASRPFLSSPWSWFSWALLLPGAALWTRARLGSEGPFEVLLTWCLVVLAGGLVEGALLVARGTKVRPSSLAAWVLRAQGNLSLIAGALSLGLVARGSADLLPGLWLLLLGYSFYTVGGLSFPPFRRTGLIFEAAGALALWPGGDPLLLFALGSGLGCLQLAWGVRMSARR